MVRLRNMDQLTPAPHLDLRRRHGRDLADTLVERAAWLLPEDRHLIEAVYREGLTALAVARLREESPRAVRRRIRKLVERMMSVRYEVVMRQREGWPATRRRVATVCVLQGRPMRATATHLRLSLHVVRRQMDAVQALIEARS